MMRNFASPTASITSVYLSHQLAQFHTLRRGRDVDRRPLIHREALLLHDQLTQRTLECASSLRHAATLGGCVQPMLSEVEGRLQDLDGIARHEGAPRDAAVGDVVRLARTIAAAKSTVPLLRAAAPVQAAPELHRVLAKYCHHRAVSHILAAHFLSGVDGSPPVVVPLSLRDALSDCYAEVRQSFGQTLRLPALAIDEHEDCVVVAPQGSIRYTLQEILKNAACAVARRWTTDTYVPPLRARIACRGSMACLSLTDAGGGLSPSEAEHIWSFGYSGRSPPPSGVEGFGLGLPLGRVYARLFGGELRLRTTPNGCEAELWHPTCGVEVAP